MPDEDKQDFRLDIFKLLRDELSVSVNPIDAQEADPQASTLSGEALTKVLREHFGLDEHRVCELGTDLAAHGRTVLILRCTSSELRAARLMPPS